jgi:hypothetical protein
MPLDALPVHYLFTLTLDAENSRHSWIPGGPQGSRVTANIVGGKFDGPQLRGTIVAPAGDWVTLRANGSLQIDVRVTLVTDDGASILMQYKGIGTPDADGHRELRTAPQFETGDDRYSWLNDVQAVGIGKLDGTTVSYDLYQLV